MTVRKLLKLPFGPSVSVAKLVRDLKDSHEATKAAAQANARKAKDVLFQAVDQATAVLLSSEAIDEMIRDMLEVCLEIIREKIRTMEVDAARQVSHLSSLFSAQPSFSMELPCTLTPGFPPSQ